LFGLFVNFGARRAQLLGIMSTQRPGEPNGTIDTEGGSISQHAKHHILPKINTDLDIELKEGFDRNHGVLTTQNHLESSDTRLSTSMFWMAVNTLATIAIVGQLWAGFGKTY
jgi:hypothetical protein